MDPGDPPRILNGGKTGAKRPPQTLYNEIFVFSLKKIPIPGKPIYLQYVRAKVFSVTGGLNGSIY